MTSLLEDKRDTSRVDVAGTNDQEASMASFVKDQRHSSQYTGKKGNRPPKGSAISHESGRIKVQATL